MGGAGNADCSGATVLDPAAVERGAVEFVTKAATTIVCTANVVSAS